MLILNKYTSNLYFNYENIKDFIKTSKRIIHHVNHLFRHKNNFMRDFIFFYSVFLTSLLFSPYSYKDSPEFKLKVKLSSLFLLESDYNEFLV